jgi:hypothetical protein
MASNARFFSVASNTRCITDISKNIDPAREAMIAIDDLVLKGKPNEALRYASALRKSFPDHPYPLFSMARILTDNGLSLNAFGLDSRVHAIVEDFNQNFAGKSSVPAYVETFFKNLSFTLEQNPHPAESVEESQIYSSTR